MFSAESGFQRTTYKVSKNSFFHKERKNTLPFSKHSEHDQNTIHVFNLLGHVWEAVSCVVLSHHAIAENEKCVGKKNL